MSTRKWIFVLLAVVVAATLINLGLFTWGGWQSNPQLPVPTPQMARRVPHPPKPAPTPVAEPQPVPGPSTGAAPRKAWWPGPLTAEQATRRAASDAFLMRSRRLDDNYGDNIKALQSALIDQRYDEVEQKLDDILAKSIADPVYDFVERDLSDFVDGSNGQAPFVPKVEQPVIDAWVKARPKSAWAHYSAGLRWIDQALEARGEHFANQVSDEHWAMMHRFAVSGRAEIKKALTLNPKMYMAWTMLMNIDMMDTKLGSVWQDYIGGSKQRPYTFMLPDQIEVASEPRWGGDYGVMDAVARKTITKIDHNPRFWELLGYAASDRGYGAVDEHCTPCTLEDWTTSLREYNAALAYSDRPTWLAGAGYAALHLKRYAVAYRYFERAVAYEPQHLDWKGEMSVLQALCDPNWSREKFESLRQESVEYGFIEDQDYPRAPGDCQYHQAELPWGSEALPEKTDTVPYNVAPENPVFQPEPRQVMFPQDTQKLASPDGKLAVMEADTAGTPLHQLVLQESATGKMTQLYTYSSAAGVAFNSSGTRLVVQDDAPRVDTVCLVFDLAHGGSHVDLLEEFKRQIPGKDPSFNGFTFGVRCSNFWNDDTLTFGVQGLNQDTHASVNGMYRYDASSGKITVYPGTAGISVPTGHP